MTVPQLSADGWPLRVHGLVEEERTFSYRDLVDTARWQGVLLADLLDAVGVQQAATQVTRRPARGTS